MLTDAHLHLQEIDDPDGFLKLAKQSGFGRFLSASTSVDDWQACLDLSVKYHEVVPFIGTHPWFSDRHDRQRMFDLLVGYPSAQVGEIGLDALKNTPDQESVFIDQLELAASLDRVCVIHCVKDYARLCKIMKERSHPERFLIHGFSGGVQEMEFLEKRGAYFTFSATLGKNLVEAFKRTPLDKILIESDANAAKQPDLGASVFYFASLKEMSVPAFSEMMERNAAKYLGKNP